MRKAKLFSSWSTRPLRRAVITSCHGRFLRASLSAQGRRRKSFYRPHSLDKGDEDGAGAAAAAAAVAGYVALGELLPFYIYKTVREKELNKCPFDGGMTRDKMIEKIFHGERRKERVEREWERMREYCLVCVCLLL